MTLDTAKRIIQEQGEQANKEACAVIRGGMTICEPAENGRRIYTWIKVLPTDNDNESSITIALKRHRERNKKIAILVKSDATPPTKVEPKQMVQPEPLISPDANTMNQRKISPIYELIGYIRKKFNEFVKFMDGLVEE